MLSKTKSATSPQKSSFTSAAYPSASPTASPTVTKLPFNPTYRADCVYVITDSRSLHVYRIPPDRNRGAKHTAAAPPPITTPSEEIMLPRSARHRAVSFFPRLGGGENGLLIIGRRRCEEPAPPIGVPE